MFQSLRVGFFHPWKVVLHNRKKILHFIIRKMLLSPFIRLLISCEHVVVDKTAGSECFVNLYLLLIVRIDSHFQCSDDFHGYLPPFCLYVKLLYIDYTIFTFKGSWHPLSDFEVKSFFFLLFNLKLRIPKKSF